MKRLFYFYLFLLSISSPLSSQENEKVSLSIEIYTTKYNYGSILLALYNSEDSYMKEPYKSADIIVEENKTTIVFKNLAKGEYAFSFFHDLNENKKMDTNFLGIPKEPYQFSNGEKGRLGPPKFEKSKFNLSKDEDLKEWIE